jgi:hypothetical protein
MKIKQGITSAEALKKRISQTTTNSGLTPPPATTSTLPSPSMVPHDDRKFNHKFRYKMIRFCFLS